MIPIRRQILIRAFKLFDVAIVAISFTLIYGAASSQIGTISIGRFLSMQVSVQAFIFFLCFFLVWHITFSTFGLYRSRRLSSRWSEVKDILKASSVGSLLLFIIASLFKIDMVTPIFVAVFWALTNIITIISRIMLRLGLEWIRTRGKNLRHVAILGTNQKAVQFAQIIETRPGLGYCLLGFVDNALAGSEEFQKTGYPLLCDFNSFPSFARDHVVDEVWIVLPLDSFDSQVSKIVILCQKLGIIIRSFSSTLSPKPVHSKIENFDGDFVITSYPGAMDGWPILIKRSLDISLSVVLFILFSPLFLITSLLIKITSHGPVFFKQDRVGLNRRRFNMYKFRTMTNDAEQKLIELEHLNEVSGPVFKIKDDPRVTPVGKLLRKTSIDELPQLINVLKGEMSLVGPRPLPVRDYKGFYQDWHRRRLSVLPGITCLWQVQGRNSIPFKKWMELDLQYIDQWYLWLDFKILLKTILAVFRVSEAA